MTDFVFCNWFLCVFTSVLLVITIWHQRFLLIKPSFIVIIFFHVMIQWAATVNSPFIETYLPDPWMFALLAQGFPLIGLLVSMWIGRRNARVVWQRLVSHPPVFARARTRIIVFMTCYLLLYLALYFSYVPLSSTGLYAIFMDPESADMARERSLKLIESGLINYGYAFMAAVFAPMLAILLSEKLVQNLNRGRRFRALVIAGCIGGILVAVSLTGARSYAASIILAILLAWLLSRGLPLNPFYIALAVLGVLIMPTLLTIWRSGFKFSVPLFWNYLSVSIFGRVFFSPMKTGMWYVHYAQTEGLLGIQAVARLASLLGLDPINAPNMLGRLYAHDDLESINMNTCYVFAYYCYFGWGSFLFSLLGLWLLDVALLVYRRIGDNLLLACVASASVTCVAFVNGEYTSGWVTNGFGIVLFMSLALDRLTGGGRRRLRTVREPAGPACSGVLASGCE